MPTATCSELATLNLHPLDHHFDEPLDTDAYDHVHLHLCSKFGRLTFGSTLASTPACSGPTADAPAARRALHAIHVARRAHFAGSRGRLRRTARHAHLHCSAPGPMAGPRSTRRPHAHLWPIRHADSVPKGHTVCCSFARMQFNWSISCNSKLPHRPGSELSLCS